MLLQDVMDPTRRILPIEGTETAKIYFKESKNGSWTYVGTAPVPTSLLSNSKCGFVPYVERTQEQDLDQERALRRFRNDY